MSRSSSPDSSTPGPSTFERSAVDDDRAQTGPLPALAATVVVGAALALYAGGLYDAFPSPSDPRVAELTLERASAAVAQDGVLDPADLSDALSSAPAGYDVAVSLSAAGDRWRVGPASPPDAATASEPVSVRVAPGVVATGRLRVEVWQ